MTEYWDSRFLRHLNGIKINNIMEVGARYGNESIELSKIFNDSIIYAFECNPLTVNICKNNLNPYKKIFFFDYGLGNINENIPFYLCDSCFISVF